MYNVGSIMFHVVHIMLYVKVLYEGYNYVMWGALFFM